MARRAAAADDSATRAIRAGATRTTRVLLGARSLRMARLMAVDSRRVDSGSPWVRMGSRALAMVSLRLGLARGILGLLKLRAANSCEREESDQWRDARESSASI